MTRRSGLTLVEVLTALFIMALGTVAILTLFPFGAMQMGQAIRDSRSIESAFNADAYMRTYWKTNVVEPNGGSELFYQAMIDPDGGGPLLPATGDLPSYPVAIDPMGYVARLGTARDWVGDVQTNLPRHNLNIVTNAQYALRLCSLTDTMGFDEGVPNGDRELRYNWLWILQKPRVSEQFTCNETVVVFDRRAHFHTTLGAEDVLSATVNPSVAGTGAVPGLTSVTFDGFNQETNIRPGTWICDVTIHRPGDPNTAGRLGMRNANFYRVVSINGNTVELQTPIMPTNETNQLLKNNAYTATFVVWRGVSGVFVKPPLKATVAN
jgi:hypothetical protein